MAKGGTPKQQTYTSPSSDIIKGLSPQIGSAIQDQILNPDSSNALTQREIQQATQTVRSGYGARGMADSGIAQRGEQQATQDILLNAGAQKAQNIIGLLGAGSGNPTLGQPAQPRGVFGLK